VACTYFTVATLRTILTLGGSALYPDVAIIYWVTMPASLLFPDACVGYCFYWLFMVLIILHGFWLYQSN
jgi:hypothetical protein